MNIALRILAVLFVVAVLAPERVMAEGDDWQDLQREMEQLDREMEGLLQDLKHPPKWAAIAYARGAKFATVGMAKGHDSKAKAEKAALADCQGKGLPGCKAEPAFNKGCAYFTWGGGPGATKVAAATASTAKQALALCRSGGAAKCAKPVGICVKAE